jgi:hypothetical protein
MISREQIEQILKTNGVSPAAPQEQIRSVLLSARFHEDEVDTAMMVLRENTQTNQTRVEGLHKVFRTNESLSPEEISALLGIEVDMKEMPTVAVRNNSLSVIEVVIVLTISIILAAVALLFYMYNHQIGLYHPTSFFG